MSGVVAIALFIAILLAAAMFSILRARRSATLRKADALLASMAVDFHRARMQPDLLARFRQAEGA